MADLIWSKLSGVFSKEVLHAQHVSAFCHILAGASAKGRRQLDCAGVVTTTLAVVQRLCRQEGFQDLAGCRLQVVLCICTLACSIPGTAGALGAGLCNARLFLHESNQVPMLKDA